MRIRDLFVAAAFLSIATSASAEPCVPMTVAGEPAWQLIRIGSGGAEARRLLEHCEQTCKGEWVGDRANVHGWCRRKTSPDSPGATYDPRQLKFVERAAEQYVQTGQVDQWTGGMAGFEIGVALHESLKRNAQLAAEKKRLEELRLAEEERQRRLREEREREEQWARLLPNMKLSTEGDVGLKLESEAHTIGLKFDGGDSSLAYRSATDLAAHDDSNDFFSDCLRYDAPVAQWTQPYRDVRHLKRAVVFVRRTLPTLYATPDVTPVVDEALAIGNGCKPKVAFPEEDMALPPNAIDLMQELSLDRKAAAEELDRAVEALATAEERRDAIGSMREAERDPKVRAALDGAAKQAAKIVAEKRSAAETATKRADDAVTKERSTLVAIALRAPAAGGPVALCEVEQMVVDRMKAGLRPQQDALRKTEALLGTSRNDARAARTALRTKVRNKAVEEIAKKVEEVSGKYLAVVERAHRIAGARELRTKTPTDPKRLRNQDVAELLNEFRKMREEFRERVEDYEKAKSAKDAGAEYGRALAETSHSLAAKMRLLNDALAESGLWSTAGETLAGYLGPTASAAFEAGELAIELTAAAGDVWVADRDVELARENLRAMRESMQRTLSIVSEKEARVRDARARNACLSSPPGDDSCPDEAWTKFGVGSAELTRIKSYAKKHRRTVILRQPNAMSLRFHGKRAALPKPGALKDAHTDLKTGLVRVPPGTKIDGFRVDANGYVHDLETNAVFYSDFDLQGVYEGRGLVRMDSANRRAELNLAVHGGPVPEKERLFQHGSNDEYLDKNTRKPLRPPKCTEDFLVIEPDCSDEVLPDAFELRAHYAKKGYGWPYEHCVDDAGRSVPLR